VLDELLCNVLRMKIQMYFHDFFFEFFSQRTLYSSSYGDYLLLFHGDLQRTKWGSLVIIIGFVCLKEFCVVQAPYNLKNGPKFFVGRCKIQKSQKNHNAPWDCWYWFWKCSGLVCLGFTSCRRKNDYTISINCNMHRPSISNHFSEGLKLIGFNDHFD